MSTFQSKLPSNQSSILRTFPLYMHIFCELLINLIQIFRLGVIFLHLLLMNNIKKMAKLFKLRLQILGGQIENKLNRQKLKYILFYTFTISMHIRVQLVFSGQKLMTFEFIDQLFLSMQSQLLKINKPTYRYPFKTIKSIMVLL